MLILIVIEREKDRVEKEQEVSAPQQVSTLLPIEEMMNKMVMGILNTVDEKLKAISNHGIQDVSSHLQLIRCYLHQRLHQKKMIQVLLGEGTS